MRRVRVIPVLLLKDGGLVKSVKFKDFKYVGDPINAVKIFNEKEVDEIVILDIDASKEGRAPDLEKIKE
ncbi:MAG: HisA/HisF-related TIM barrel protein, partial [Bacteroidota bacterium]